MKKTKKILFSFCVFLLSAIFIFIPFYVKSQEPDSRFGINAFVSNRYSFNEWNQPIDLLKDLGVSWSREEFMWEIIEPEKGKYNYEFYDKSLAQLKSANINVLGIIDYSAPWASTCKTCQYSDKYIPDINEWKGYVGNLVDRYGSQVKYWQIWNEPNVDTFLKSQPATNNYYLLLKSASEVIKSKNQGYQVVLGGTSGVDVAFLRELKSLGAGNYFDVLAAHPYRFDFKSPPEGTFMEDLKNSETISKEYGGKPVWFTEFGWPTDRTEGVSEEIQAKYLLRTYIMSFSSPDIKKLFWYDFRNDGNNLDYREHNFGIINRDYSKKKSYIAYKNLIGILEHSQFDKINNAGGYGVYDFSFVKGNSHIRAIWKINGRDLINLDSAVSSLKVYDYLGNEISLTNNITKTVEISDFPIFIVNGETNSQNTLVTYGQNFDYQYLDQSPYLELKNGEEREVWLKLKNIGTATWTKNSSSPTVLGTCRDVDRESKFFTDKNWIGANRAAKMQEDYVRPGDVATFSFKIRNNGVGEGLYREFFCPLNEGLSWMKDVGIYWDIATKESGGDSRDSVIGKDYSYEIMDQSPFISVNRGDKFTLTLKLKNTGAKSWEKNTFNVGTSRKKDRISVFGKDWEKENRIVLNEGLVNSGEVGTFLIEMKAPSDPGTYKEYFRPVVEGVDWLNDRGIYWFIKVN